MLTRVAAVLADQSVASPAIPWFTSSSISCAACGRCCRPAILWGASFPLALASVAVARPGSGAAGRRRLRGEHGRRDRRRRSCASLLLIAWIGTPARAAGADRHRPRCRRCCCSASVRRGAAEQVVAGSRRRAACCAGGRSRRLLLAAASRRCRACSSPTAATRRRVLGQAGEIIYVGEGLNASVAVSRAAERRAQLPQRRQGAGVERAAGHAAAAHARPPDDAGADDSRSRCWSSAAAPA